MRELCLKRFVTQRQICCDFSGLAFCGTWGSDTTHAYQGYFIQKHVVFLRGESRRRIEVVLLHAGNPLVQILANLSIQCGLQNSYHVLTKALLFFYIDSLPMKFECILNLFLKLYN